MEIELVEGYHVQGRGRGITNFHGRVKAINGQGRTRTYTIEWTNGDVSGHSRTRLWFISETFELEIAVRGEVDQAMLSDGREDEDAPRNDNQQVEE